MKLHRLSILVVASLSLLAASGMAGQLTVAPPGKATMDKPVRESLIAAEANFAELYAGGAGAETVTYAASTALNFSGAAFKTVTLTGNVTFTTANLTAGKTVIVRAIGSGGTRTFTFPAGWVFVGAAAPANVASGKTGVFVLRSFGTADASVVARYEVQP